MTGRWMSARPHGTMLALALTVLAYIGCASVMYTQWWPSAQREMLRPYVQSSLLAWLEVEKGEYGYRFDKMGLAPQRCTAWTGEMYVCYFHAAVQDWLQREIYVGRTVMDLAIPPTWFAAGVLIAGLIIAVPLDRKRAQDRRLGIILKGPELVGVRAFNRQARRVARASSRGWFWQ